MKTTYLITGLLIGGVLSFILTRSFYQSNEQKATQVISSPAAGPLADPTKWNWADSLDALKIAANSHKIVYEDSNVRVLQVILAANSTEPVHTHQWRSVMWFTQATPMVYYKYAAENQKLLVKDSMQIPQMPAEVLNRGDVLDAEEPHAIKNIGSRPGIAYRVEFKKDFRH